MAYLVQRYSNSTISYSGTSYQGLNGGTRKLYIRSGTSTSSYPLTTNTSASQYCKFTISTSNTTRAYLAKSISSSTTTSRTTSSTRTSSTTTSYTSTYTTSNYNSKTITNSTTSGTGGVWGTYGYNDAGYSIYIAPHASIEEGWSDGRIFTYDFYRTVNNTTMRFSARGASIVQTYSLSTSLQEIWYGALANFATWSSSHRSTITSIGQASYTSSYYVTLAKTRHTSITRLTYKTGTWKYPVSMTARTTRTSSYSISTSTSTSTSNHNINI